jgi:hypothetical protein
MLTGPKEEEEESPTALSTSGHITYKGTLCESITYILNAPFFFNRHYNPGWVSACSTVVEHSQQEGFTECRC